MNKSKASLLNALTALVQMVLTSILGLVLSKCILSQFGSDYNGINATVNQMVSSLMVLEGGFTLASNVALFEPYSRGNYDAVNGILSATKNRFCTVGLIALAIGVALAVIYPFTITSAMPVWMIIAIMLTVLIPACFNLGFSMKYRVLLLVEQKEYVINVLSAFTYVIGTCSAIVMINLGVGLLSARIVMMLSLITQYLLIAIYCKKKYPFIRFDVSPTYDRIKGTGSVIVLKLTSVIYTSFPIIIISTIPGEGTLLASVYAVYKSVISVVRNALMAVINAPRLGFGALFAEKRKRDARELFVSYEIITCMCLSVILGATSLLIMPFVVLYTTGITDANYVDVLLAAFMLLTTFLELIHIPSGQMIQMKGDFAASKKIQTMACVVLIVALVLGRAFLGLYGIVFAILIAAVVLCVLEIGYTARFIFERDLVSVGKCILPAFTICVAAGAIGFSGWIWCENYLEFILYGCVSVAVLSTITFGVYYFLMPTNVRALLLMLKRMIVKKKGEGT